MAFNETIEIEIHPKQHYHVYTKGERELSISLSGAEIIKDLNEGFKKCQSYIQDNTSKKQV